MGEKIEIKKLNFFDYFEKSNIFQLLGKNNFKIIINY